MSKFIYQFESYVSSVEQIVETWFQKHFGYITPGTPDHAVALAAKADLTATLTGNVPVPAPAPAPEPAPEPAPVAEPAVEPAPEPEPAAEPAPETDEHA